MPENLDDRKGWERFDFTTTDGLRLAGRKYGWEHEDPLPVICLAGLTRNSADFHGLALHLAEEAAVQRRVLCLDYRGRGMSQWDRNWENYNPVTEAEDVMAAVTAAGIGGAAIVGTSRGGLIAMMLTAMRPGLLKAVVLNDVGPKIDGLGLVRIRAYVEKGRDFKKWDDAAEALRTLGGGQFPAYGDAEWESQARLIYEEQNGKVVRRYDPKLIKTLSSINLDNPLPAMWPQFAGFANIPVLVVRGERSDLLSRETLEEMHGAHPGMQSISVPDQGHAPDLGSGELPARIAAFIEKAEGSR